MQGALPDTEYVPGEQGTGETEPVNAVAVGALALPPSCALITLVPNAVNPPVAVFMSVAIFWLLWMSLAP
jgi:hypothetical protein